MSRITKNKTEDTLGLQFSFTQYILRPTKLLSTSYNSSPTDTTYGLCSINVSVVWSNGFFRGFFFLFFTNAGTVSSFSSIGSTLLLNYVLSDTLWLSRKSNERWRKRGTRFTNEQLLRKQRLTLRVKSLKQYLIFFILILRLWFIMETIKSS